MKAVCVIRPMDEDSVVVEKERYVNFAFKLSSVDAAHFDSETKTIFIYMPSGCFELVYDEELWLTLQMRCNDRV